MIVSHKLFSIVLYNFPLEFLGCFLFRTQNTYGSYFYPFNTLYGWGTVLVLANKDCIVDSYSVRL